MSQTTLHGVFVNVFDQGVFMIGASGIGKSEVALELVTRGHKLIADDACTFTLKDDSTIMGACPPNLAGFIEIRGLGVLDVKAMFAADRLQPCQELSLIIKLTNLDDDSIKNSNRLTGVTGAEDVFGIAVPVYTVPLGPGRNAAVLIEAAVRNHMLKITGYDAGEKFVTLNSGYDK